MTKYTESTFEEAALEWFEQIGYATLGGPTIAPFPDGETPEREDYGDVILDGRLKSAIARINPNIPIDAQENAFKQVKNVGFSHPSLIESNRAFHKMLRDGVDIEYPREDGSIKGDKVYLIDKENINNNDWIAINQFTVIENKHNRRPDIIVYINGLPLAVIELKNPADEKATFSKAYNQLETYKSEIPSLFVYNELLIASDNVNSKVGSLTANKEWFMRWRTMNGIGLASNALPQLEVLIKGMFEKQQLMDMITNFTLFQVEDGKTSKILAAYHQVHATNKAIIRTQEATSFEGDKRAGVVWHTQGSGKSFTMVFYTGKLINTLDNPTIVVITDRNDLDDQLFSQFSKCSEFLRQTPVQVENREDLKEKLKVSSGGIIFTTVQKFFPEKLTENFPLLTDRRNVVVIADEAHRSQYGFGGKVKQVKDTEDSVIEYGYAKYMRDALPNASFIGFTGTPIELIEANTRSVFGDYIDIYDITQAVEDKATVKIYYEPRLAKINLLESEKPKIDPQFEELTEGEEVEKKEELKP